MNNIKFTSEDITNHQGIGAVIKNNKGFILMQEHVKYGFWTIPVGKVKEGHSLEEGLKKEILEECNIIIKECKELMVREYTYNRNGNKVLVSGHLFEVIDYEGEIRNNEPEKHTQQIFMPIEEIKKLPYISDLTLLYLESIGFIRNKQI